MSIVMDEAYLFLKVISVLYSSSVQPASLDFPFSPRVEGKLGNLIIVADVEVMLSLSVIIM